MNIYIGIFVLVALVASGNGAKLSTRRDGFAKMLSSYKKSDDDYKKPSTFENALLALPLDEAREAIASRDVTRPLECQYIKVKCDPYSPWRTIDGTCNNLKFPWWGATNTPYDRLLPPAYGPNDSPRCRAKDGSLLENPRTIALTVNYPKDIFIDVTNYVTIFGQFMFHDLSHFAETRGDDGEILKCRCGDEKRKPDCINIPIPKNDYYNKDKKCLVQIRSRSSYPDFNCYTKNREQLNEVTAWFDLSHVYGNTQDVADSLREMEGGRLKVSNFDGIDGDFLPTGCPAQYSITKNNFCFNAGDGRVNQYPLLTTMHTLFLREHNRIADELRRYNKDWDDEFLYQTARTINIAEFQNIIYYEYLPIIIGKQFHKIFDLDTEKGDNYFMGYNPYIFPNVDNEFSAAASRFGHATTIPYVSQVDDEAYITKNNSLWNLMHNPTLLLYPFSLEGFAKGCAYDKANWFSPHITEYLFNYLEHNIGPHNPRKGHSLPAWNSNRGRDHGIRPYNDYRPFGGLRRAKDWDDLTYIPKKQIERLRKVYNSVDDIDLWVGGMSEYPLPDGIVGPTFAYILARGMRDWKFGDRWYFENGHDKYIRFTMDQLRELKNANLARIICDNSNISKITGNPFLLRSKRNKEVSCDSLPKVSLAPWLSYKSKSTEEAY